MGINSGLSVGSRLLYRRGELCSSAISTRTKPSNSGLSGSFKQKFDKLKRGFAPKPSPMIRGKVAAVRLTEEGCYLGANCLENSVEREMIDWIILCRLSYSVYPLFLERSCADIQPSSVAPRSIAIIHTSAPGISFTLILTQVQSATFPRFMGEGFGADRFFGLSNFSLKLPDKPEFEGTHRVLMDGGQGSARPTG